ncbi:unnamed protein product [Nezara viridula]|uniref:Neuropeptide n=1 Tax=Nezara viridula TaxID=85310 RepID=A0A9P0E9V8_NEZVI|nr:unnamed protein product [Nezara viridula]
MDLASVAAPSIVVEVFLLLWRMGSVQSQGYDGGSDCASGEQQLAACRPSGLGWYALKAFTPAGPSAQPSLHMVPLCSVSWLHY